MPADRLPLQESGSTDLDRIDMAVLRRDNERLVAERDRYREALKAIRTAKDEHALGLRVMAQEALDA